MTAVSNLPFEILQHIFYHVKLNADLLECQYVCHRWYQASVENLYRSIYFGSEPRTTLLMRTLSDSPNLGKLIKNVQFTRGKANLNTPSAQLLLQLCPNIENISAFVPDKAFWQALIEASNQGRLSCLQRLPEPHSGLIEIMECYLNTALEFQNTLKELVYDQMTYSNSTGDFDLKVYKKLAQSLKGFSQLDELKIVRLSSTGHSTSGLSDLDPLIQDVPLLTTLTAVFYPTNDNNSLRNTISSSSTTTLSKIKPRPDIKSFYGTWESMTTDDAINYFMHKFSILNILHIGYNRTPGQVYNISSQVMYKFMEYLSKIPFVKVECALNKKMLINVWIQFIKSNSCGKRIGFSYEWADDLEHHRMTFTRHKHHHYRGNQHHLFAKLFYPEGLINLPHKEVLEKAGEKLEKIEISNMQNVQRSSPRRSENPQQFDMIYGHWLDHLLNTCPSLKELAIYSPGRIRLGNTKIEQHHALETLSISHVYAEIGDTVLPDLSKRLPSLKYLDLFYFGERNEVTTVQIPNTSLDTLTWGKRSHYVGPGTVIGEKGWKFYLKLSTEQQEQYFWGDKMRIYPSIEKDYTSALQEHQCFDITCKSISYLKIKYRDNFVDQKYSLK